MQNILHIYTRVSSLSQEEKGSSLDAQRDIGIKRAQALGFNFKVWNEGGQSSAHDDLNNRPVLLALLARIGAGEIKHLFVYNTDRLSRNQQTWSVIRFKLLNHGVILHTASGQMALKNPIDDLMLGILSEISQYDNKIRAERSRLGKFHKVQSGGWKGGPPPFGYRLQNKRLEIDPFESLWIKRIYEWYVEGTSIKEIQQRLSLEGVVTRRGHRLWSTGSLQVILRNTLYIGYFDYTDKMLRETVRVSTPPIIEPVRFSDAQEKRRLTRLHKHQVMTTKHNYLLRGKLVCGHCGHPMGGRTYKKAGRRMYYCCKNERTWKIRSEDHKKWGRGSGCSMIRSIDVERTDKTLWRIVKTYLIDIVTVQRAVECTEFEARDQLSDRYSSYGAEFCGFSINEVETMSDSKKEAFVKAAIEKIVVFFDEISCQHSLEVSFTTDIARLISFKDDCSPTLDIESDEDRGDLHFDSEPLLDSNRGQKDVVVQQPLSSQSGCWTKVRHGRVIHQQKMET